MIVSPKVIRDRKILTSKYGTFSERQFQQPNGIDVRIREVWSLSGYFIIGEESNGQEAKVFSMRREVTADENGFFHFKSKVPYSIDCFEHVNIPEKMAAMIYGRSTLNRNGIFIRSSFYDSGFSNTVGFTLYPWVDCYIKLKTRIAQIVFFEANSDGVYTGQYNNEKG